MRADFQRHQAVPVHVLAGIDVTGAAVPDAEDARQQEVLEAVVGEAVRPGMPAEAFKGDGVRCDPAPAWGRAGKRLVFDFEGLPVVDVLEHGAQVAGVDAPSGAAHRIEGRQLADPGFLLRGEAVRDRPQLRQVAGRVRFRNRGWKWSPWT